MRRKTFTSTNLPILFLLILCLTLPSQLSYAYDNDNILTARYMGHRWEWPNPLVYELHLIYEVRNPRLEPENYTIIIQMPSQFLSNHSPRSILRWLLMWITPRNVISIVDQYGRPYNFSRATSSLILNATIPANSTLRLDLKTDIFFSLLMG